MAEQGVGSDSDRTKVFLSYRRSDTQHVAGRFADKLDDRFAVFMDIDTIPPGVDFTDYVRRAVGSCDVLLAFIGERWAETTDESGRRRLDDPADWVAEEIRTALSREVRVIPVLVDGAGLPDPAALPESLRPLTSRQTLPLRHASFSADAARLITAMQTAASSGGVEPYASRWEAQPAPPPVQVVLAEPTRRSPRPRRSVIIGTAIALALIMILVGWLVIKPNTATQATSPPGVEGTPLLATPSSPAASSPPPVRGPARTVAQLRALVPAALAPTCRKVTPEAEVLRAALQAAVQCVPAAGSRAPKYLFYFSYSDSAAAARAFAAYYGSTALPPGTCTQTDGELQYDTQGGRPVTGTLRCYTDSDTAGVFAWTADQLAIVGSIADPQQTFAELKQFWELAGPITADGN